MAEALFAITRLSTSFPIAIINNFERLTKNMPNFTRRHMNYNTQPLCDEEATNRKMDSFNSKPDEKPDPLYFGGFWVFRVSWEC